MVEEERADETIDLAALAAIAPQPHVDAFCEEAGECAGPHDYEVPPVPSPSAALRELFLIDMRAGDEIHTVLLVRTDEGVRFVAPVAHARDDDGDGMMDRWERVTEIHYAGDEVIVRVGEREIRLRVADGALRVQP